ARESLDRAHERKLKHRDRLPPRPVERDPRPPGVDPVRLPLEPLDRKDPEPVGRRQRRARHGVEQQVPLVQPHPEEEGDRVAHRGPRGLGDDLPMLAVKLRGERARGPGEQEGGETRGERRDGTCAPHRHSIFSRRRKNDSSGAAYGRSVSSRSRSAPRSRSPCARPRSNSPARRAKYARSDSSPVSIRRHWSVSGSHSVTSPAAGSSRSRRSTSCRPTTSWRRDSRASTVWYPVAMKSERMKMTARRRSVGSSSASAPARSVPLPAGRNARRSLISRSTWRRPLAGASRYSTRSVKNSAPIRSLLRAAASASTAATSAPSSPLVRRRLPKPPDALRS